MPRTTHRVGLVLSLLLIAAVCEGCSSANPRDPLEPVNRSIYKFNDGWDKVVSQPVAEGYKAVLPPPVRNGVSNFFGNWRDTTTAINNLLQFKLGHAASDVGRIIVQSMLMVVDLPAPFGPRNPKTSPCRTSKSTPATATKSPNLRTS